MSWKRSADWTMIEFNNFNKRVRDKAFIAASVVGPYAPVDNGLVYLTGPSLTIREPLNVELIWKYLSLLWGTDRPVDNSLRLSHRNVALRIGYDDLCWRGSNQAMEALWKTASGAESRRYLNVVRILASINAAEQRNGHACSAWCGAKNCPLLTFIG